jgi:hypothetical protein
VSTTPSFNRFVAIAAPLSNQAMGERYGPQQQDYSQATRRRGKEAFGQDARRCREDMMMSSRSLSLMHRRDLLAVSAAFGSLAVARTASAQDRVAGIGAHQPGEAVFRAVLPEEVDWQPFPAFPPSVRLAIVVGEPSRPGPYTIRVKVPAGVMLMPHRHPEDRVYTVISGVFYIGLGDHFDQSKLQAYPPGSVVVLPGGTLHFHAARSGEYVSQISALGPLGLDYLDPRDDPRRQSHG